MKNKQGLTPVDLLPLKVRDELKVNSSPDPNLNNYDPKKPLESNISMKRAQTNLSINEETKSRPQTTIQKFKNVRGVTEVKKLK